MSGVMRSFLLAGVAMFLAIGARADLPGAYDLRSYGWITPAENQGDLGSCWAFAATTVFQSSLLKNGLVTDPGSSALDVSVWHLATHNGNQTDLTYPYDGWGGDFYYAVGYWTRGMGEWSAGVSTLPVGGGGVMETTHPLNVYPIEAVDGHEYLGPYVPPAAQELAPYRLVQSFDFSYTGSGPVSEGYRNELKQLVLDHGALSVGMATAAEGESFYNFYNKEDATFRYTGTGEIDHEVVIAGWDDEKVVTVNGVTSTGAWLVQNSWGPGFGQDGYFWVAYDDAKAAGDGSAFDVRVAAYDSDVLQNQIYAGTVGVGGDVGERTMAASKMLSQSDEVVMALGLYVMDAQEFSIAIYDEWDAAGPEGDVLMTMEGLSAGQKGYVELMLNSPLMLAGGDAVYVVVDFGDGTAAPIMVDKKSLTLGGVDSFLGLSWGWDNGVWKDLAEGSEAGIFFMKGLTAVPEPGTVMLLMLGLVVACVRGRRSRA